MSDPVLVSVIMPAYNAASFIAEAISSVQAQTYSNWELIVVDDGSTDNTSEVVKKISTVDSRVKYIYQTNGKQSKARNTGIKNTTGEFIAFLDADDKWTTEKLSVQVPLLKSSPGIDLLFCCGYVLNDDNSVREFNVPVTNRISKEDIPQFIEKGNPIPILSVLTRRSTLADVQNFDEDPNIQNVEDYHLWFKLLLKEKVFMSIDHRLYYYREHAGQSTYLNRNLRLPLYHLFEKLYPNVNIDARKKIIQKIRHYLGRDYMYDLSAGFLSARLHERGSKGIFILERLKFLPRKVYKKLLSELVDRLLLSDQ